MALKLKPLNSILSSIFFCKRTIIVLNSQPKEVEFTTHGKKHNACNLEHRLDPTILKIQNDLDFFFFCPFKLRIWALIVLETIDVLKSLTTKKPKKSLANVMRKFQDVWFVKMPWVETIFYANGNLLIVRCKVYIKIKRK